MKESMSITTRSRPGPAPADQARRIDSASTRSSWRTCPKLNERRKLPSVEGAIARSPSSASVPPEPSTSQSSNESAPSTIAWTSEQTFPARLRGARALAEIDRLIDKPLEAQPVDQMLVNITPALATRRSSSNPTASESDRAASAESLTMRLDAAPLAG
jgi:hypothetical protein